MKHRPGTYLKGILFASLIIMMSAATIPAAEVTLAWDASCNEYPDLIGYNIYFKAESSVATDPDGAELIYIALTDSGFDPDQPTYTVTGLSDNVRYYFQSQQLALITASHPRHAGRSRKCDVQRGILRKQHKFPGFRW